MTSTKGGGRIISFFSFFNAKSPRRYLGILAGLCLLTGAVVMIGQPASADHQPTDVVVTKDDSADPVTAGDELTYTITVENTNPNSDTEAILLGDRLPESTTFVSLTAPAGFVCRTPAVGETGAVRCRDANGLAEGQTVEFVLVVEVASNASGTLSNTVSVSLDDDPNLSNNRDTETTTVNAG